jgi:hypothetical protein
VIGGKPVELDAVTAAAVPVPWLEEERSDPVDPLVYDAPLELATELEIPDTPLEAVEPVVEVRRGEDGVEPGPDGDIPVMRLPLVGAPAELD